MGLIALDASALIALLDAHDPHHDETLRVLSALRPGQLIAHTVNIADSLVAAAKTGREHETLLRLEALGIRIWLGDNAECERVARLREKTNLKLPDCYPIDTALTNNAQLLSFDRRQLQQAESVKVSLAEIPGAGAGQGPDASDGTVER
jgi:predicted nucleic acid-binding protein